jgi:hypothetical protein
MIPSEDRDYGDLGQAFPPWADSSTGAILQPPKPEIRPAARVLERVLDLGDDVLIGTGARGRVRSRTSTVIS